MSTNTEHHDDLDSWAMAGELIDHTQENDSDSRFQSIARRSSLLNAATARQGRLLSNLRLTPLETDHGVWQVLASAPGITATRFTWQYTLISHGKFTSTWSLLDMKNDFESAPLAIRPTAILRTSGPSISTHEIEITSVLPVSEATKITVVHYYDSWKNRGKHIGFRADEDNWYEWRSEEIIPGSGETQLVLWQSSMSTALETIVACVFSNGLIMNPMDHNKPCWCLDIDTSSVRPDLALLSLMSITVGHPKCKAWFAKKDVVLPPPTPLCNFAFQDDEHVYRYAGKFWGNWEEERIAQGGEVDRSKIASIRVFNKGFVERFALHPRLLRMLNEEAIARANAIRYKLHV